MRRWLFAATIWLAGSAAAARAEHPVWRAYETVEEAWIHERYRLLAQQAPAAINAARLDLELKVAELQRRAIQVRHVAKCEPATLNGGVWQFSGYTLPPSESSHVAAMAEYRKHEERIRQLTAALTAHPQFSILKRAQARLWKTPQYRDAHRRYLGRLQQLQTMFGQQPAPSVSTAN